MSPGTVLLDTINKHDVLQVLHLGDGAGHRLYPQPALRAPGHQAGQRSPRRQRPHQASRLRQLFKVEKEI